MVMSDARKDYIQTYLGSLDSIDLTKINNKWDDLNKVALKDFYDSNLNDMNKYYERHIDLRYKGQEHTVKMKIDNVSWTANFLDKIKENFNDLHEFTYSFKLDDVEIELVNIHLTVFGESDSIKLNRINKNNVKDEDTIKGIRNVYFEDSGWTKTTIYDRTLLYSNQVISGPAIIEEQTSSTLILNNQVANIDEYGNIIIKI